MNSIPEKAHSGHSLAKPRLLAKTQYLRNGAQIYKVHYITVRNGHGNFGFCGKFTKNRLCSVVQSIRKKIP
jgi:hypothetical protein